MAAKVLGKSMDMNKPSADKFEIGVIKHDAKGKVVQERIEGNLLNRLLNAAHVLKDSD